MPEEIRAFVAGMLAAGFLVCAAFFLRFWCRTRDFLFATFAIAFSLLALHQALSIFVGGGMEDESNLYLLRAAAFGVIIAGVLRKNVRG